VKEAAAKYPTFNFVQIDSCGDVSLPNLCCAQFQEDQVAFVAGAAAAMVSKTGVVGGYFGPAFDALKKFENGKLFL